ncbi:MAG: 30S ribosomal protein S9 [Candidatus Peregrinibacteria bacterium]
MPPSDKKRQYFSGLGKRKTAIARVKLYEGGSGDAVVNGMKIKEYFCTTFLVENALSPVKLANLKGRVDVEVITGGGGKAAQSDAVRHGLSRALLLLSPELRSDLKRAGFLRRDARIKERKKPGLKRARRAPQWQKR